MTEQTGEQTAQTDEERDDVSGGSSASVQVVDNPPPHPEEYLPFGVFSFRLDVLPVSGRVLVSMRLPEPPQNWTSDGMFWIGFDYWKYGPEPGVHTGVVGDVVAAGIGSLHLWVCAHNLTETQNVGSGADRGRDPCTRRSGTCASSASW